MKLSDALENSMQAAKAVGCLSRSALKPYANKTCMAALPDLTITNLTNSFGWGPVTDGVTFPQDPMQMLREGLVNPSVSTILGAQTNDSFLFLSQDFTTNPNPNPNPSSLA